MQLDCFSFPHAVGVLQNWTPALVSLVLGPALAHQRDEFTLDDPNFLFIGNGYIGQNHLSSVFNSILEDGIPELKGLAYSNSIQVEDGSLGDHLLDLKGTNDDSPLRQALVTNPLPWKWVTLQDQVSYRVFIAENTT